MPTNSDDAEDVASLPTSPDLPTKTGSMEHEGSESDQRVIQSGQKDNVDADGGSWEKEYDGDQGANYYRNKEDGRIQWEKPEEFTGRLNDEGVGGGNLQRCEKG